MITLKDTEPTAAPFTAEEIKRLRGDFPILSTQVHGKPLIYLDNAATSQKPRPVLDRLMRFYTTENANIHRGVHYLADAATEAYEEARRSIARHINANSPAEVIFVKGATEGINLVARAWGQANLNEGDEVLITAMEHHANLVPWQLICAERGARLVICPVSDAGELDMEAYARLLGPKTRMMAACHVSNSIGTINPIGKMVRMAKGAGAATLIDACQSAPHARLDVQALGADFLVFSGHKACGPTGTGVLWGRENMLEAMPPYQSGGDMIDVVRYDYSTFAGLPNKFEAGTPHMAGVVGLAAALDYMEALGRERIAAYERALGEYALSKLRKVPGLRQIGTAEQRVPIYSFVARGAHPLDLGTMLDLRGIAVRTGNHCTQPLMERMGVSATVRASFFFYNTFEEADALADALADIIPRLSRTK